MFAGIWKEPNKIIEQDVIDYYAYLPALFIYGDLSLQFRDVEHEKYSSVKMWGFKQNNGKYLLKFAMGMSIMYAPFFLLAHLYASLSSFPADGYSVPYAAALWIATMVYFILGLLLLRKLLLQYFSDKITALVIIGIALGTNVTNYLIRNPAMSHVFSFFLFTLFIYLTDKWHKNHKLSSAIAVGLLTALIVLVRPANLIVVFVFILWGLDSFQSVKEKFKIFVRYKYHLLLLLIVALIALIPQMLYWKYITGNFFQYSYQNEQFYFLKPAVGDVLFGFRKGWFIYTPIMFIAVFGLIFLYKNYKRLFIPFVVFFLLNMYVISSWWCWWYGGSYGHRAFIESYVFMAFPLAALFESIAKNSKKLKFVIISIVVFLIFHNLIQNYKFYSRTIHHDSMTKEAYFDSFFKLKPDCDYYHKLRQPDYENALKGLPERTITYKDVLIGECDDSSGSNILNNN